LSTRQQDVRHASLCAKNLALFLLIRCDDKAFKKLMSNYGSSRSEESCSAVVELLERVARLHKQLELKESQAEMDMDQVLTTTDLPSRRLVGGSRVRWMR